VRLVQIAASSQTTTKTPQQALIILFASGFTGDDYEFR
jgi:hypothetical protein